MTSAQRMVFIILACALGYFIMTSLQHAHAAECRSEKGDEGYWSWRYIKPYENKRCWYHGRRRLPKEDLYWSIMKPEKKRMDDPSPKYMDPVFPKRAQTPVKVVKPDEYNELDALADHDTFLNAKPMTWWPSVTPFTPWTERAAGAFP